MTIVLDGTNGATIPAATAAAHATRLDQMQAPFRNRIINGDFQVSQVNASTSVTVTAAAALQYVIDQFYAYCTGANVTGQRVAGAAATGDSAGTEQYRYQFTGAASVTKIGFAQRIEQSASYDMASQTSMVGVNIANSLLTTVTWTAWYANTADTFGTLASPTRTQIGTGSITVSSAYTRYYIPITMPAGATTGIEIEFSVGAQTSGTWQIGRVQWEKVPSAAIAGTVFEQSTYVEQLQLVERFFRKKYVLSGFASGTTIFIGAIEYVGMRATPIASVSTPVQIANGSASFTQSSAQVTLSTANADGALVSFGNFTGLTANAIYCWYVPSIVLLLDARL